MTTRVDVTRAALMEIGRPDLAEFIRENRKGDPSCSGGIYREDRPADDSTLIVRAMRLGHQYDPEGAPVGCPSTDGAFPACDHCRGNCEELEA